MRRFSRIFRRSILESLRSMILFLMNLITMFFPIRLLFLREKRIGEFAPRTDFYLRRLRNQDTRVFDSAGKILGERRRKTYDFAIVGDPSNQQLLDMFTRHLRVIKNETLSKFINTQRIERAKFSSWLPTPSPNDYGLYESSPILTFTEEEEEIGRLILEQIGISEDDWFVCFHARDSQYIENWVQPSVAERSAFRNCSIENYIASMQYVTSLGGYAVRVGTDVLNKLPYMNDSRIVDYGFDYRSDFGDIFLLAKCKFFVGGTSGVNGVPRIFNVPIVDANNIPMELRSPERWRMRILLGGQDIFLPKPIWSIKNKKILNFDELMNSDVCIFNKMIQLHWYIRNKLLNKNAVRTSTSCTVPLNRSQ